MCTIALNIIHGDIKDKEKLNSFNSHNKKKWDTRRESSGICTEWQVTYNADCNGGFNVVLDWCKYTHEVKLNK